MNSDQASRSEIIDMIAREVNPARRFKNVNQRLIDLGLYEVSKDWDPSKSDHDNRLHDLLDEVESLREVVDRTFKSQESEK